MTITHCPREKLKLATKHARPQAPPAEARATGSEGTPARLRAQPARRVRATRRARLPRRRWCAHARRRERGHERASFSLRVASPRQACAGLSLCARRDGPHAPRLRAPRRRPRLARAAALRPHCAPVRQAVGASGHFLSRAAVGRRRRPEPPMAGRRPAGDRRAGR